MRVLKRIIAILMICLTITVTLPTEFLNTTLTVDAHSGRTDRYGGHKDNKNKSGLGYYHYHCGGYPAHLHDNGVCPYAGTNNVSSFSVNKSNVGTTNTASNSVVSNKNSSNNSQSISTDNITTSEVKISDTAYDNAAFNASYYASRYSDVYKVYGDDAKWLYDHFISSGIAEGRQSSEQFSIFVYRDNNQDLIDAFGDDLIKYYDHFIEYGCNENRVSR